MEKLTDECAPDRIALCVMDNQLHLSIRDIHLRFNPAQALELHNTIGELVRKLDGEQPTIFHGCAVKH